MMTRTQLHQLMLVGLMFCSALAFATADPIQSGYAAFEKKQWRDAYEYWVPEADKGNARAQFYLSILFSKGLGVEQSEETALTFLMLSAEGDFPPAQYHLGNNYQSGQLIEQDSELALYWWRRSAEQEFVSAQLKMGAVHYLGRGATQDIDKATEWYRRAAKNGSPQALETLARLGVTDIDKPQAEVFSYSSTSELQQAAVSTVAMGVIIENDPDVLAKNHGVEGSVLSKQTSYRLQNRLVTENTAAITGSATSIVSNPIATHPAQSGEAVENFDDMNWIEKQPDENFTLQVFSSDKQESAERVARTLKSDGQQVTSFAFGRFGYRWYGVLMGSFETMEQAIQAKKRLLENNKLETPWIRRFRSIRKQDNAE
ncbi:SPOR domain-containing protein [Sedimenticola selenatireducens]|uniref:SPOR domain-containing protein n=1 Tax=Sedimenticola selenatireducens TaxID=191960 RepID=A0A557SMP6_9GAMM|nr:SPOR domain-containing protein [Sedimenticola selenatireducens]TVO78686.1 hypothetical protein FHP88_00555 [Sedimenticola selenatireducens]TVT62048.1 MAG: hypothetical protein FHK78_15670 [Sedimenticola selenatireducens]